MPSLVEAFANSAKEAAADVEMVASSPGDVYEAVRRATQGAASIVLGSHEFLPDKLWDPLRELAGVIKTASDEELTTAEAGITTAFAGVASTGSVCIAMGPPLAGAASLLMPLHIVLISAERIVGRPRDLFDSAYLDGEGLRRNLVFITGPSATADMGPLVRGVHGPHRLKIFLLGAP